MAVTIEDIKKLRAMTGAGLADVKNALNEAEGDFDKAKELLRERGLAIAAKRSDRETSNGCVLVKKVDGFAAMVAVKCETDFVAAGKDLIALVGEILDAAIAARCTNLDEVKALKLANGDDAATAVQHRSGVTGEKMELDGYNYLVGDNISVYDHMGRHTLATMVQLDKDNEEAAHKVAMQVAAMKPVALDEASVPQAVKDEELKVAIQKTKEEQVEKAANLNEQMIQNIAKGRMAKFFKENCLVDQEFQFADEDGKISVKDWLKKQGDLNIVAYKRFTLLAD